jgi:hypothetical protein
VDDWGGASGTERCAGATVGQIGSCTGVGAWGMDPRQLGGMGGEDLGQRVGQILQQMKAVGHLAGGGRPEACRFRVGLRAVPHDHLDPGMCLKPPGHRRGFPVGEQGQGPPPGEVEQEGAIGMALAQGELVHAEDLWGADRRVGGGRMTLSSVLRLTVSPKCQPSRTPAAPPRAKPMARRRAVNRNVRRAQGLATPGRRSVKMRREQVALRQKNFRTRSCQVTR